MCLSLCDYRYVTDGENFGVMEHQNLFWIQNIKRVLMLIEMARLYDEMDNFKVIESVLGRE